MLRLWLMGEMQLNRPEIKKKVEIIHSLNWKNFTNIVKE